MSLIILVSKFYNSDCGKPLSTFWLLEIHFVILNLLLDKVFVITFRMLIRYSGDVDTDIDDVDVDVDIDVD